jgi:hypothetical protein
MSGSTTEFTGHDLRTTLNRALRSTLILAVAGSPVIWRVWGWRSVLLFLVGAVIAATGILEWRQLMMAILDRLQAGNKANAVGPTLVWFFLRLGAAAALLYVSLRYLDGKIYALLAGLALSLVALLIEAIRLFHSWSL